MISLLPASESALFIERLFSRMGLEKAYAGNYQKVVAST